MPDRKAALIRNGADFAGLNKTLLPVLGALIMLLAGCRGLGTSPAPPPPPRHHRRTSRRSTTSSSWRKRTGASNTTLERCGNIGRPTAIRTSRSMGGRSLILLRVRHLYRDRCLRIQVAIRRSLFQGTIARLTPIARRLRRFAWFQCVKKTQVPRGMKVTLTGT